MVKLSTNLTIILLILPWIIVAQEENWTNEQIQLINADCLHDLGFTGKGVTIAHFDDGCDGCDDLEALEYARTNGLWEGAFDFVEDTTLVFKKKGSHGTNTVSIVHGKLDNYTGVAYDAGILVARTENVNSETHQEERDWREAVDWAIEKGADIITSSLQYNEFDPGEGDFTYQDMDGKTTIITNAADYAASKGIIVVTLQGNFGNSNWHWLTAPGDADSVITVGAATAKGMKAGFSGFGPSYDGRVKPDIMAMGQSTAVVNPNNKITRGNGTSFAAPAIAGLLACLKQAHPERSNMELISALRQSGDRYHSPDTLNGYGYGIPDGCRAHEILSTMDQMHASSRRWVIGSNVRFKMRKNKVLLKSLNKENKIANVTLKSLLEKPINGYSTPKVIDTSILRQGSYLGTVTMEDNSRETLFFVVTE